MRFYVKVPFIFILIMCLFNTCFTFLQLYIYSDQIIISLLNKKRKFKFKSIFKGQEFIMDDIYIILISLVFTIILDKLFFKLYIKWNKDLFWDLYGYRIKPEWFNDHEKEI